MIDDAYYKLEESRFFLERLGELDRSPGLDKVQEFRYYFSAFLAASRSPLQYLCPDKTIKHAWDWVEKEKKKWTMDERDLYRTITALRTFTIHITPIKVGTTAEMLPKSHVRREPRGPFDGGVITGRAPGMQETKIGVMAYHIKVGLLDLPAVETCARYLDLVGQLVSLRDQAQNW
jgi:hypothetical protein